MFKNVIRFFEYMYKHTMPWHPVCNFDMPKNFSGKKLLNYV